MFLLSFIPFSLFISFLLKPGLTLREEHRLAVFENGVLRRIFGPKRDEMTGGWRKLHDEELHSFYSSPNILRVIKSRIMRWTGHVVRMREINAYAYKILVGKPEGKSPLGRPGRRWDNIKVYLREIEVGGCGLHSSDS
jgi:hypothetical protein